MSYRYSYLTTAGLCPPVLHCDITLVPAGLDVGLRELALEVIHHRVFAQSLSTGSYVGLWVNVRVASRERSLLQDITPTSDGNFLFSVCRSVIDHIY